MIREYFYNETIKTLITAFATIFESISIVTDRGDKITVPVFYAPREKFLAFFLEFGDLDTANETILPRIGFELFGLNFAPERYSNPLDKVQAKNLPHKFTYTRVPYDFSFTVYVGTIKFEDSLKIVEQIIPFFTPELNITVRDKRDLGLSTDVPVVLNSVGFRIDYQGSFDNKRTIQWELQFTAKAWMYGNTINQTQIKKTIVDLTDEDINRKFATLISEVIPQSANKTDPHEIVDTVLEQDSLYNIQNNLQGDGYVGIQGQA
jgi:hypothetical protein